MNLKPQQKNNGFTLVEMLVALSLFTVVVTIVAGSLLVLVSNNQSIQGEQSVMAGLSFAMDSMTREIRTGTHYVCKASNSSGIFNSQESFANNTEDCDSGNSSNLKYQGVSFIEAGSSVTGATAERIAYFYDKDGKTIRRRVGDSPSAESIISNGIIIDEAEFFVTGTDSLSKSPSSPDVNQPTVTIIITASEADSPTKPYILETTITQRELDL